MLRKGTFIHGCGNMKFYCHLKQQCGSSFKVKQILTFQVSSYALWYFPREMKACIYVKACL